MFVNAGVRIFEVLHLFSCFDLQPVLGCPQGINDNYVVDLQGRRMRFDGEVAVPYRIAASHLHLKANGQVVGDGVGNLEGKSVRDDPHLAGTDRVVEGDAVGHMDPGRGGVEVRRDIAGHLVADVFQSQREMQRIAKIEGRSAFSPGLR